ncbi:patatin-like phospholipase family protein [Actinomadura barringtoniae]|uniref:Patatin-like phospholipase family protein n=1 Tax=Actinomadura barringtoniae TaxID=1427535 RepID=A0A939PEU2_9ACTN|nr:patatin-like phospholipase family protein [Actinomadura barringtoniae]MBO2450973.1 patatin-like phospholipase family protein [Actinomadura barringtoniae]
MTERTLVLGGGGVAGIAWANGVLAGLADAGTDVTDADLLIGTSAGSNVAAQLASGLPPNDLYQRQIDPALQSRELIPEGVALEKLMEIWAEIFGRNEDPVKVRIELGAMALATETVPESARRAVIESRLPVHAWPERKMIVTVVEATTGKPRLFDRSSGVDLVDAVAASSAVPGVWPPVTIDGVRYIDGGMRTSANADLAEGSDRVLVLAPLPDPWLDQDVANLISGGSKVEVIVPDDDSLATFGTNPLDPASRVPAAKAGRAQGQKAAATIAALWHAA